MSDPALPLQAAYVARIKAEVASVSNRVHDEAPQGVSFPFVQIGDIQVLDDGAECLTAVEVNATLHVWSRADGSVEARSIAAALRGALHEWLPDLSASSWRCVEHMHQSTRAFRESDGKTTHAVLQFRALIDPV